MSDQDYAFQLGYAIAQMLPGVTLDRVMCVPERGVNIYDLYFGFIGEHCIFTVQIDDEPIENAASRLAVSVDRDLYSVAPFRYQRRFQS